MEDVIERLKPCPFCGKVPKIILSDSVKKFRIIRCQNENCPASCVSVMDLSIKKLVKRWNSRTDKEL